MGPNHKRVVQNIPAVRTSNVGNSPRKQSVNGPQLDGRPSSARAPMRTETLRFAPETRTKSHFGQDRRRTRTLLDFTRQQTSFVHPQHPRWSPTTGALQFTLRCDSSTVNSTQINTVRENASFINYAFFSTF